MSLPAAITLRKLQARERAAQAELQRRYFPKVYALCFETFKSHPLAEEYAQDVWTDFLYREVDRVRDPAAIGAYLRMMTVRRCARIREFAARHEDIDGVAGLHSASEAEAIGELDRRALLGRLESCLRRLTAKARRLLRLRFLHEMTQEQIGQSLRTSKQYAGRVINRSLAVLRACLEEVR